MSETSTTTFEELLSGTDPTDATSPVADTIAIPPSALLEASLSDTDGTEKLQKRIHELAGEFIRSHNANIVTPSEPGEYGPRDQAGELLSDFLQYGYQVKNEHIRHQLTDAALAELAIEIKNQRIQALAETLLPRVRDSAFLDSGHIIDVLMTSTEYSHELHGILLGMGIPESEFENSGMELVVANEVVAKIEDLLRLQHEKEDEEDRNDMYVRGAMPESFDDAIARLSREKRTQFLSGMRDVFGGLEFTLQRRQEPDKSNLIIQLLSPNNRREYFMAHRNSFAKFKRFEDFQPNTEALQRLLEPANKRMATLLRTFGVRGISAKELVSMMSTKAVALNELVVAKAKEINNTYGYNLSVKEKTTDSNGNLVNTSKDTIINESYSEIRPQIIDFGLPFVLDESSIKDKIDESLANNDATFNNGGNSVFNMPDKQKATVLESLYQKTADDTKSIFDWPEDSMIDSEAYSRITLGIDGNARPLLPTALIGRMKGYLASEHNIKHPKTVEKILYDSMTKLERKQWRKEQKASRTQWRPPYVNRSDTVWRWNYQDAPEWPRVIKDALRLIHSLGRGAWYASRTAYYGYTVNSEGTNDSRQYLRTEEFVGTNGGYPNE